MDVRFLIGLTLYARLLTVECGYNIYEMSSLCNTKISMQSDNAYGIDMAMTMTNNTVSMATCNVTVEGRDDFDSLYFYFTSLSMSAIDNTTLRVLTGQTVSNLQAHTDLPETISQSNAGPIINTSYLSENKYLRISFTWSTQTTYLGLIFRILINSYSCEDDCDSNHVCSNDWCISPALLQTGYSPCANISACSHDEDGEHNVLWIPVIVVGAIVAIIILYNITRKKDSRTSQSISSFDQTIRERISSVGQTIRECLTRCQRLVQNTMGRCQSCHQTWLCFCSCTCSCCANTISDSGTNTEEAGVQTTEQTQSGSRYPAEQAADEPPPYNLVASQPPPYTIIAGHPPTYETYLNTYRQPSSPPPAYETVIARPDTL